MKFEGQVLAIPQGGTVAAKDGQLTVEKADSVVLLLAAATDSTAATPSEDSAAQPSRPPPRNRTNALRSAHVAEHHTCSAA